MTDDGWTAMDDGDGFDCTVSTMLPRILWVLSLRRLGTRLRAGDAERRGRFQARDAKRRAGRLVCSASRSMRA